MQITTYTHAAGLLADAGEELDAAGAEAELAVGLLRRLAIDPGAYGSELLLASCADAAGAVRAVLVCTERHPLLIVGFGDPDARTVVAMARESMALIVDAHEINGATRWSEPYATALAALRGVGEPELILGQRAFELRELRRPRPAPGAMRMAGEDDRDLALRWADAFTAEALPGALGGRDNEPLVDRFLSDEDLAFWEVDGAPRGCAAINRRTDRSSTVSLVYTPTEYRGRGVASQLVAALTQRELDDGAEYVALFTDLANPTSNHIYQELGYEAKADFGTWHIG